MTGLYRHSGEAEVSPNLFATSALEEAFLKSILSKEGKCWTDFYKYVHVKRRKGNKENIPAIKDCNGRIITDAIDKVNTFISYYLTVFSNEGNIHYIQSEKTDDPFTTDIKTIRRRIKTIGKNKSVGPD
jgi:hypothetical protein